MPLAVNIFTPERVVRQEPAESVVVPAVDGELGILYNHAALLAELQVGQVRIRRGAGLERLAVSGGFVQVLNNEVSIFAETAEMAHEIDVERARQSAERSRISLRVSRQDVDLLKAEAALQRALVRLRVAASLHSTHPSSIK